MVETECGIACIITEMAISSFRIIELLKSLQHRGRDSFGISYSINDKIRVEKHHGLVRNLDLFEISNIWLGHVRYSTSTKMMKYCQPILSEEFNFSIVHNGNIRSEIWSELRKETDYGFDKYDSDTYKLMLMINYYLRNNTMEKTLEIIINKIPGSFCILVQTSNYLYILRDKYGIKPLSYNIEKNRIVINSEAESENYKFIEKGSIHTVNINSLEFKKIYQIEGKTESKRCIFENIYFMKENTFFDQISIREWRKNIGLKLWEQTKEKFKDFQKDNVLVCGVPSSGIVYGESFSHYSGFNYFQFLKKKKDYPHRTFILDTNQGRINACKKKYFLDCNIKNKIIILLDDSVVRGNTMKFLISYLRESEPAEIHLLVGCPEIVKPCFYGVDFPDIEELIANKLNNQELVNYFNLDSITYLDYKNLKESDSYCSSCFDGNYFI